MNIKEIMIDLVAECDEERLQCHRVLQGKVSSANIYLAKILSSISVNERILEKLGKDKLKRSERKKELKNIRQKRMELLAPAMEEVKRISKMSEREIKLHDATIDLEHITTQSLLAFYAIRKDDVGYQKTLDLVNGVPFKGSVETFKVLFKLSAKEIVRNYLFYLSKDEFKEVILSSKERLRELEKEKNSIMIEMARQQLK